MTIDVRVDPSERGWAASVRVEDGGAVTEHDVSISPADLKRYGAEDAADLVRRAFQFLLVREPATSILRRFAISDISRYFPEFEREIKASRRS